MHNISSPRTDDAGLEQQLSKSPAPRVTLEAVNENIVSEHYFTAAEGCYGKLEQSGEELPRALDLLTFCVLVLKNGFTVTGESACASPENFDPEIGRTIARQNAVNKIWPLMGYQLRQEIYEAQQMKALSGHEDVVVHRRVL